MRSTDSVDIELFHKFKLIFNLFARKYIAFFHIGIMVIYTLEFYGHTVEIKYIALNLNRFEARNIFNGCYGFIA